MSGTKTEICGLLDWNQTSETRPRFSVICEIMQDILDGLKFIHDKDEVHRDLTPPNGNLFNVCNYAETVLYSSASRKWKLADFGLESTVLATHNTTTARRQCSQLLVIGGYLLTVARYCSRGKSGRYAIIDSGGLVARYQDSHCYYKTQ